MSCEIGFLFKKCNWFLVCFTCGVMLVIHMHSIVCVTCFLMVRSNPSQVFCRMTLLGSQLIARDSNQSHLYKISKNLFHKPSLFVNKIMSILLQWWLIFAQFFCFDWASCAAVSCCITVDQVFHLTRWQNWDTILESAITVSNNRISICVRTEDV